MNFTLVVKFIAMRQGSHSSIFQARCRMTTRRPSALKPRILECFLQFEQIGCAQSTGCAARRRRRRRSRGDAGPVERLRGLGARVGALGWQPITRLGEGAGLRGWATAGWVNGLAAVEGGGERERDTSFERR